MSMPDLTKSVAYSLCGSSMGSDAGERVSPRIPRECRPAPNRRTFHNDEARSLLDAMSTFGSTNRSRAVKSTLALKRRLCPNFAPSHSDPVRARLPPN
jgi:hypothetical protein